MYGEYTHSKQLFLHCYRQIVVDKYYQENFCEQICSKQETRECNWQSCPINCLLGDFGPWSDCDPCVEKQVGNHGHFQEIQVTVEGSDSLTRLTAQ